MPAAAVKERVAETVSPMSTTVVVAHSPAASATADGSPRAPAAEPPATAVAEAAPAAWAGEARTLTSTTQVLEVGVASGTHGWLRVRAELGSTGQVEASVVASSADAVKSLHQELPQLSAYLAREQVDVASLAVSANPVSTQDAGAGAASDASGQMGGRGQTAQQQPGAQASAPWFAEDGKAGDPQPLPMLFGGAGGGWVNVRV